MAAETSRTGETGPLRHRNYLIRTRARTRARARARKTSGYSYDYGYGYVHGYKDNSKKYSMFPSAPARCD